MPTTIPQDLLDEIGKPNGKLPFWLFLEIVVSVTETATTMFRLVRAPEEKTFLGKTWYPFPFKIGAITMGEDGELPRVRIDAEDPMGLARPWLHVADGFRGKRATVYWVHESTLLTGSSITWDFEVASANVTEEGIELECRMANLFEEAFPHDTFVRGRCRWLQGSEECGDFRQQVDCGRTLEGCLNVRADWIAAGLYPIHPRRYEGFDSIPGGQR